LTCFTFTAYCLDPIAFMPIPLADLQIHSEMPADLYQPGIAQSLLILARRGLSRQMPPPLLPPPPMALPPRFHPAALRSLLLSSSSLGISCQRGFVGESSRNASPGYLKPCCYPQLLIGWEEDDPCAGSVYKYAGSDLNTCRPIIIVGLKIHDLNSATR